jgi:3-deoxy-D-manno-octulosonate 8-phosphate phosphatase (KDO 8-P phosphatase)
VISTIIFDFDGVFTDGSFYYSVEGKELKKFGSHDARAIEIGLKYFNIEIISADFRGFEISKRRVSDMKLELKLISESDRQYWIKNNFEKNSTAFVADSFTDIPSLPHVNRSFAPKNAHPLLIEKVSDKLQRNSGSGAVSEVIEILLLEKTNKCIWEFL